MKRKRRHLVREPILSDDEDEDVRQRPAKRVRLSSGDIRNYMPIRDDLADLKKLRPRKEDSERRLKQASIASYMSPRAKEEDKLDESEEGPTCSICLEPCDLFTTTNACTCPHHYECLIELSQHVEDAGHAHGLRPKCPVCRNPFSVVRRRDGCSVKEAVVAPEPRTRPLQQHRVTMVMPADGRLAPHRHHSIFDQAATFFGTFPQQAIPDESALLSGLELFLRRGGRRRPRRRRSSFLPLVREKMSHIGWGEEECERIAERFDEVYTNDIDDDVAVRKMRLLVALREDTDMHLDQMLDVVL